VGTKGRGGKKISGKGRPGAEEDLWPLRLPAEWRGSNLARTDGEREGRRLPKRYS